MMRLIPQQVCRGRAGFTLTELLVVMGVMAVLAGLTAVSYRTIAKDAKLASGKNTVMSVLENARALAMKNNRPTMVMFVPRFTDHSQKDSRVTAYIAEWRGDAIRQIVDATPNGGVGPRIFERFLLVNGVHPRQLPAGISVAGPNYQTESSIDNQWFAPPNPLKPNEVGRALAVLYLPDGSTSTTLPATATYANNYPFIDFDNDGFQDRTLTANLIDTYYMMIAGTDEPAAVPVPFLAVFSEEQARSFAPNGDSDWGDEQIRLNEMSQYINANADRIHFNRYTGVAMK